MISAISGGAKVSPLVFAATDVVSLDAELDALLGLLYRSISASYDI